jgi:hypothetical protein
MRRELNSIKWQLMILLTAAVDISMLFVELAGGRHSVIDAVTLTVLLIFTLDLLLRLATYRNAFFYRVWNNLDLVVLAASFALFVVGVETENDTNDSVNGTTTSSSTYAGASSAIAVTRGSRALRGVVLAIRIIRGVRVAKTLANTGRGTQLAARHVTGALTHACARVSRDMSSTTADAHARLQ